MGSRSVAGGLDAQERDLLQLLWNHGPMSRWEVHERTGRRPNSIGDAAAGLLEKGIVREKESIARGAGRPRIPLEIDPTSRTVVGVSVERGGLEAARFSLLGVEVGERVRTRLGRRSSMAEAVRRALSKLSDGRTLASGVSVPGLVDTVRRRVLLSSAAPDEGAVDLDEACRAQCAPVVVDNNMHAMAARWRLAHRAGPDEDLLLVYLADGAIGAAVLVNGRPNRGCVSGANELGHTRFFVETPMCYCGHTGCLERICSTEFLRASGGPRVGLEEALAQGEAPAVLNHLSRAIANAVNFMRPHRVVLAGALAAIAPFADALREGVRRELFPALSSRVRFERWEGSSADMVLGAGHLAIASVLDPSWSQAAPVE